MMSSPKKNVAYEFDIALVDTSDTGAFKAAPTIAAGDFKVSTDNGALVNLATLPSVVPVGSIIVKVNVSQAEMNGDKIIIQCIDAAGGEWDDLMIFIDATIANVDDIIRSTTPANTLDVDVSGDVTAENMRGTDDGALASEVTSARMSELDDTAGKLVAVADLIKTAADAIKVVTDKFAFTTVNQVDSQPISIAAAAAQAIRDEILPTQNVAFSNIPFIFVAASDHVTPVTSATGMAVTRSINGSAFGSGTGTISEVGNGSYQYDASAADMNGGIIQFRLTASGGTPGAPDDVFFSIITGGGV